MREPKCESATTGDEAEEDEEDEDDLKEERDVLEQPSAPIAHVQTPEFPLDPQGSPGQDSSPLEDHVDRLEPGE